jgi:DNA repair exonuclease SbcCD ATPase subunit
MISIKSIEWRNFLGYGDYPTKVDDLDALGPVLVMGSLEESEVKSNGAGKSSVINAIIWCLFGRTAGRAKPGDNVVNWYIGQDCVVEIKTTDGWTIRRTRKCQGHDDLLVYHGDKDESRGTNTDAQAFLLKHFNLDYEIFAASAFFMQSSASFLEMGDTKRKEALERLLGIDKLNVWAEVAKEKAENVESNIGDVRREIERLEIDVERYRASGEENRVKGEAFERARLEKIAALDVEISGCQAKIAAMDQKKIEALIVAWDAWSTAEEAAEALAFSLHGYEVKITSREHALALAVAADKAATEALEQLPSEEEIARLTEQYKSFESERERLKGLRAARVKKESDLALLESSRLSTEKDAERYEAQAITLVGSIKAIADPVGNSCVTCGQAVSTEEIDRQKKQNAERREKIKAEALGYGEQASVLREKIDQMDASIGAAKEALAADEWTEEYASAAIAAVTPKFTLRDLEAKTRTRAEKALAINLRKDEIQQHTKAIAEAKEKRDSLTKEIAAKKAELERTKPSVARDVLLARVSDLEAQRGKMRDREKQRAEEEKRSNPYADVSRGEFERAAKAQEDMDTKKTRVQSAIETLNHYQYIQKAYSDRRKIKSMIIGELIPYFNQRIQYYLSAFEIDLDLEFTQTLGFQTEKWPFDFCSGGERKRISVAIMFAMHDLWLAIYGRQCNVMALDEVDTALDESGAQAFVSIINNDFAEKRAERPTPDTIFVISHRNDMVDAFPKKMMIRRDAARFSHLVNIS